VEIVKANLISASKQLGIKHDRTSS